MFVLLDINDPQVDVQKIIVNKNSIVNIEQGKDSYWLLYLNNNTTYKLDGQWDPVKLMAKLS